MNSTVVSQQEGSGFEPAFVLPLPGGHTVGADVDGEYFGKSTLHILAHFQVYDFFKIYK